MSRFSPLFVLIALTPLCAQTVTPFGKKTTPDALPAAPSAPAAPAAPALPAQPQAPQGPVAVAPSGTTSGNYSSSTVETTMDKLFDTKSDSIDLENGTVNWKGRTLNVGDSRLMRARFERYLASPQPEGTYDDYVKLMERIEKLIGSDLFTGDEAKRVKNNQAAWELLFKAAESEFDGGASLTLANQVMKAWRQRNELNNYRISAEQQKQLDKKEEEILANRSDALLRRNQGSAGVSGGGTSTTTGSNGNTTSSSPKVQGIAKPSGEGARELAALEEANRKTKAEILATEAGAATLGVRSKLEFQSTIVGFLGARRYHHCIIASAFYRQIYKATHQEVKVGAKQMKDLFPISDFVPTLETIDGIAREAINDVTVGLRTFEQLDKEGDRFAAYERLQETYFIGEFEPAVIRIPYAKKRAYAVLARDLRDLQKFGDDRDLAAAEETLGRICAVAQDFPAARIRSKINAARQASDAAVIAAKHAAMMNGPAGSETVKAELANAAKYWPTNPKIREFLDEVTKRADLVAQRLPEFDKLYAAGSFRELFERKEEFALALMQDRIRVEQLNAVVQRIGRADMMLAQAEVLAARGENPMAWDLVLEAGAASTNDPKVLQMRGNLAPQVADYAKRLAEAERLEKAGNLSAALAAYLAAQDMNKPSKICGDAVARLGKAMLSAATAE